MTLFIAQPNRPNRNWKPGIVTRSISLFAVLLGLWLLLSGYYVPLMIGLGVASALFATLLARRMDVVDAEGHPIHLTPAALLYWPWLGWQIIKSNIDVARIILDPRLKPEPVVARLKASQHSILGRVIYANSITLTPGTVTLDIDGDQLKVHALSREALAELQGGEMDRRVTEMSEGRP